MCMNIRAPLFWLCRAASRCMLSSILASSQCHQQRLSCNRTMACLQARSGTAQHALCTSCHNMSFHLPWSPRHASGRKTSILLTEQVIREALKLLSHTVSLGTSVIIRLGNFQLSLQRLYWTQELGASHSRRPPLPLDVTPYPLDLFYCIY